VTEPTQGSRQVRPPGPPVLVAGGGPTGLTVANLLGHYGIPVVLVERNDTTSNDAKAISLDDESLRTMQLADLDQAVLKIVVPGTGTRYFGAAGRPLFHGRGVGSYPFGHPFKNPFAQPELEKALRKGLTRFPHLNAKFGTELIRLESRPDGATVTLRERGGNAEEQLDVFAVLACDGGRSTVRELLGITMNGRTYDQVWLVLDTLNDPHDERYGMHHGDPKRPHVIVPGRDGRCRYEFLLQPNEGTPGQVPSFELARALVSRYRNLAPEDIERSVVYSFHALVADRLRVDRCFLLGDAAHMMPPFAGQGLNSGVRDAANLAWKIAAVYRGSARERLLDTYESERKPHVQAVVDFSVRLGEIVMTTSRARAVVRDAAVRLAMLNPLGRRHLREMRFRPANRLAAGFIFHSGDSRYDKLVGTLLPQPRVLAGSDHKLIRLDDVLGRGFSLLGAGVSEYCWQAVSAAALPINDLTCVEVMLDDRASRSTATRVSITDADGGLERTFAPLRGRLLLLRPDRRVAAIVQIKDLTALRRSLEEFLCATQMGAQSGSAHPSASLLVQPPVELSTQTRPPLNQVPKEPDRETRDRESDPRDDRRRPA
jgi:3-(3-hydroxy-phenyl)propionate hydroxylase